MDFISNNAGMIGLLIFVTFFIGMLLWIYRPGTTKAYEEQSKIPLEDD